MNILKTFIENFSALYSDCLKATQNAIKAEYFSKLQDIKTHVDHLNLNNGEIKDWYESHLIGTITRANFYRASYAQDTYEYATFNSIFDLALETLKDFHNAA